MIKQMGLDDFFHKRGIMIWCAWIGLCSPAAGYAQAAPFDEIKMPYCVMHWPLGCGPNLPTVFQAKACYA